MADNKFNDEKQLARCEPMSRLQSLIAGKWKILILWYISFLQGTTVWGIDEAVGRHYTVHSDKTAPGTRAGWLYP